MQKSVAFGDETITVCGREGDPYFDHLNIAHPTNDFMMMVASNLRKDAVIFDIGANVGVTSCIFSSRAPNGSVYSFEPSQEAFGFLWQTLTFNNAANCFPFQLALGAKPGKLQFYEDPNSASASHLVLNGHTLKDGTTFVEVSTIDLFVADKKIKRLDFIKIDVEGFELDVLAGAAKTLKSLKPAVLLEINSFTLIAYRNLNPRFVIEKLLTEFPFVYAFEAGRTYQIKSPYTVLDFIHRNLINHGCIDDLLCCCEPLAKLSRQETTPLITTNESTTASPSEPAV